MPTAAVVSGKGRQGKFHLVLQQRAHEIGRGADAIALAGQGPFNRWGREKKDKSSQLILQQRTNEIGRAARRHRIGPLRPIEAHCRVYLIAEGGRKKSNTVRSTGRALIYPILSSSFELFSLDSLRKD
jgi:hypothetical protein